MSEALTTRSPRTDDALTCPALWVATGIPDDQRGSLNAQHMLRPAAETIFARQDSWTTETHEQIWSVLLRSWPRKGAGAGTNDRLGALSFYLQHEGGLEIEAVANVVGVAPDTVRRRLRDRGEERELEVTFSSEMTEMAPWRISRTTALEGARPLPRVQTVEPVGDDEPTFPAYFVAVADPRVHPDIRAAFVKAHQVVPHSAALIAPAPSKFRPSGGLSEHRPWCPIGDRLGIDGPRAVGWKWSDEWVYYCPSWAAARERLPTREE